MVPGAGTTSPVPRVLGAEVIDTQKTGIMETFARFPLCESLTSYPSRRAPRYQARENYPSRLLHPSLRSTKRGALTRTLRVLRAAVVMVVHTEFRLPVSPLSTG